MSKENT